MTVEQQVEAGTRIFLRAILILLVLWFLYLIRDILAVVFLAIIVAASLNPVIGWVRRLGMPRSGAVVFTYLSLLALFVLMLYFLVPPLVNQVAELAQRFPQYAEEFSWLKRYVGGPELPLNESQLAGDVQRSIMASFSEIFSATVGIFSGVIFFVVFFFLSLYMSLEENGVEKFLTSVIPERFHDYSLSLADRAQRKIGRWMFGQLLSMFLIFMVYLIGLSVMGVPYALTLALLGGLFEIVPYVGPIIAAIPALLIAFFTSPILGLGVLVFYVVAHQIESHVITPQVMKRAVGINPVAVILALLIGGKLGGILGVILAVPAAAVINVFVEDFLKKRLA
jgi:predicted PurR-regulated permease PerM